MDTNSIAPAGAESQRVRPGSVYEDVLVALELEPERRPGQGAGWDCAGIDWERVELFGATTGGA